MSVRLDLNKARARVTGEDTGEASEAKTRNAF